MTEIIGVHFKESGRMMFFDPQGEKIQVNDLVIVQTDRGIEYGQVTLSNFDCDPHALPENIRPILRRVSDQDRERIEENKKMAQEALEFCTRKVSENNLQMKVVGAEYTFDRSILLFYFTANKRVDFRKLVRDLAQNFHTRIELRQIGIRDQAKTLGGIGPCGQEICCRRYLCHFMPVSIKMAKTQGLSLNPTKISGLCGRLMCCLNYEQDHYEANTKKVPRNGTLILTEDGQGHVVDRDVLQSRVRARIYKADGTEDEKYYDVDSIEILEKRQKGHPRPQPWTNMDGHVFISEGEKKAQRLQEEGFGSDAESNPDELSVEVNADGFDADSDDLNVEATDFEVDANDLNAEAEDLDAIARNFDVEADDFDADTGDLVPCCPCCPQRQGGWSKEETTEEDREEAETEENPFRLEETDPSYEKPYGLKGRGKPRIRRGRRPPRKR